MRESCVNEGVICMCICFLRDNLFFLDGEGVGVSVRYFCLQDLGLEGTEHRA